MESPKENLGSDEDDYENYFLQPASCPYDIKEKVQEANAALFNHNPDLETRPIRITFKQELVDYEPDTEDDVNSFESYSEAVDYSVIDNEIKKPADQLLELPSTHTNLFAVAEANTDEEVEEVEEDIREEVEYETKITSGDNFDPSLLDHQLVLEASVDDEIEEENFDLVPAKDSARKSPKASPIKTSPGRRRTNPIHHIECKNHCIERLDVDLHISINRLQISEKPCPTLKLQRRRCCEKNPIKSEQKLPVYGGHKSEYGLSLEQLRKRERKKDMRKLREEKQLEVMQEYHQRKVQQNEQIFCQWLKNVSKRKHESEKKTKKCLTPTVFSFPSKTTDVIKGRPKTAHFVPTHRAVKKVKRPHTSSSCVFIQVPHNLLRRGIGVGDIFLRESNDTHKKLHFMTVS